jgi:Predicted ATPases
MINSIDIKNYRNLDGLQIDSLAKVNLITGKNNTGKSTLLEAITIYASKFDLRVLFELLEERGENFKKNVDNATNTNIQALSSLFTNRTVGFNKSNLISIGQIINPLSFNPELINQTVSLRFVRYLDDRRTTGNETIQIRKVIEDEDNLVADFKVGLQINIGEKSSIVQLADDRLFPPIRFRNSSNIENSESFQFIRTRNIYRETNGKLWDNITLTEKEQLVIETLKIIEPLVERIAFIGESPGNRTSVIKLSNNTVIFPLRSMGDGINRILTIILALVNADNGYLLIDEFENGLHHSIQEKLWDIIFNLSNKLNVQVFATTHSDDCISGFEQILNRSKNILDGKLIRLDNIDGKIKHVDYSKEELKIANEQNIETR